MWNRREYMTVKLPELLLMANFMPKMALLKIDSYANEPKFYTGTFDFRVLIVHR